MSAEGEDVKGYMVLDYYKKIEWFRASTADKASFGPTLAPNLTNIFGGAKKV